MNDIQRQIARHALGLPNENKIGYRNAYACGAGPDNDQLRDMVEKGYATVTEKVGWMGGMDAFRLTLKGAEMVLLEGEVIGTNVRKRMT